ncbi:MAG: allophanate hydrolase [Gammaproteobacteria bacterium]|nr:allophanate hydrolase [Gammaproteobacteria bacterium]
MIGWTLADWQAAYRSGADPADLLPRLLDALPGDDPAWISLCDQGMLAENLRALAGLLASAGGQRSALLLYGVPFAVKDNIDVAGFATTAACPDFAYSATQNAHVIDRLVAAGAIVIGKTNLDQFATGLSGTRSPYGVVPNSFDPDYVSGGSSSGSASVVARGLVPFALGTDTAGSGRVPAGLNNIVGLKPTRGRLGCSGVLPACRSLDCVSILALNIEDANAVCRIAEGPDEGDFLSRRWPVQAPPARLQMTPRMAVPQRTEFFGDEVAEDAYKAALARLEAAGVKCVPVDTAVLDDIAAMLYEGPWVAERYAAIKPFIETSASALHPVVRDIIMGARGHSAVDTFRAQYRLAALARQASALLADVAALVVPTAPVHVRIADMLDAPVALNTRLGRYTNFVNLLDWCAVSMPAGLRSDGLPFGLTFIAPAWHDEALCEFAGRWQRHLDISPGAPGVCATRPATPPAPAPAHGKAGEHIELAVVGAHLSGMPLNHQLTDRQAQLVTQTTTSARYRLFALPDTQPPKPGLQRCDDGHQIVVEVWSIPVAMFGAFVAEVPPPLGIGNVELSDGRWVKGFICESYALKNARDISDHGGWRAYVSTLSGK